MGTTASAIRKGRKFDQVLEGARQVFMASGFEGTSVDDIARAASVSKATLYSYFPDKRLLFLEMARLECVRQRDQFIADLDATAPPSVVLGRAGRKFLAFITSKLGQQMFRICVAESDRFPEIGQGFYNTGPAVLRAALSEYLRASVARGELKIGDIELAADQFAELCKADVWPKLMFGMLSEVSPAQIERVVDEAVVTFLARYGAGDQRG